MTTTARLLWKRLLLGIVILLLTLALVPTTTAQEPFAKITAQNAAQLKWQRGISNGSLVNARWSADKKSLFVATNAGIYRYATADLTTAPSLVSGTYVYTFDSYFSDDNQWVATSIDPGGKLRITSLATGEFWTAFEELKSNWYRVRFSGKFVLALSYANRLWVYDLEQKRVLRTIDGISDMALHPDGKQIALSDSRGIGLWDVATLQQTSRFAKRMPYASGLRFSADGKSLYTFASTYALSTFDVETRQQKYQIDTSLFGSIAYADQANVAILWGSDTTHPSVQTVDLATGKSKFSFRVTDSVQEYTPPTQFAALSPDGTRAATLSWDHQLRIWDMTKGKLLNKLPSVGQSFFAFSPDGKQVLLNTGSSLVLRDYTTDQLDPLVGYYGHNNADILFSPDGGWLSTTSEDSVVRLWKTGEWDALYQLPPPRSATNLYQVAFSPDSQMLLVATNTAASLYPLGKLSESPFNNKDYVSLKDMPCQITAYSPDGNLVACAIDTTVVVLDVKTKSVVWDYLEKIPSENPTYFSTLAFSGDGKYLAIAPYNSSLTVLNLVTLKANSYELEQPISSMMSSPDGKWLAAADGSNQVHLYEIATGKGVWLVRGLGRSSRSFRSFIAYSPDGTLIAATDQGRKVRFFEAATGKVVAELPSNTSGEGTYDLNGIAFSPDGTLLAGTTSIGIIGLWAVAP